MSRGTVLVTGACGFVGIAVTKRLLTEGYKLRALCRNDNQWLLPNLPGLERCTGDMRDATSLAKACAGADIIVHLAARKSDERDSEEINVGGARLLRAIAERNRVRLIVHISTQSVKLKKKGLYASTKAEAENILNESTVPVITFRPSVVYADNRSGIFGAILSSARLPFLPIIGRGNVHFRPIHRDDLALFISLALDGKNAGKTYDIGGPDNLAFDELLDRILEREEVSRKKIYVPIPIARFIALALSFLHHPPLTVSNVLGAAEDLKINTAPSFHDFGFTPRSLEEGLSQMEKESTHSEASVLLRYVASIGLKNWRPETDVQKRYECALRTHHLDTHRFDSVVLHHPWLIGALDAASRLHTKDSILQRKLLVAAAILETHPMSAEWLLPKNRSAIGIIPESIWVCIRACIKFLTSLPLLCFKKFLKRNAGF